MKCKECGSDFRPKQYNAEFCCSGHRNAFNNRRQLRGATLYDLEMIQRNEPELFAKHNLATIRSNLLQHWKSEDATEREGRKSWKSAFNVLSDLVRFSRE